MTNGSSWGNISVRDDNWDCFDGTIGIYKPDNILPGDKEGIKRKYFIYNDKKLSDISKSQPKIISNGNIFLKGKSINNTTGLISGIGNIEINGGALLNQDVVLKNNVVVAEIVRTYKATAKIEHGFGMIKRRDVFDHKANPLYFKEKDEGVIKMEFPSLIQAGGTITGNLVNSRL